MTYMSDQAETLQVASVGYDGVIYIFPPWEDGSVQLMAATGSGAAVRVILDCEGVRRLAMILSKSVTSVTDAANSSQ
jgi:hypothetical protein